jgi:hypothetical protein
MPARSSGLLDDFDAAAVVGLTDLRNDLNGACRKLAALIAVSPFDSGRRQAVGPGHSLAELLEHLVRA